MSNLEESPASKTAAIDRVLYHPGLEMGEISPEKIIGQLKVTENCSQGISPHSRNTSEPGSAHDIWLSEGRRTSVIEVVHVNKVWEVQKWKVNSLPEKKILISTARVTLLCNLPVPEHARAQEEVIKKYAKL
ncbi:hypothetical protein QJS10_CPB04g01116 [Acorus calamus]|uniref:Uncharacterized protein n=1 Tax=Acorus calamus TaxID=4465 RepID=A0AAV9F6L6_ACOCL|nr:hypothetical protein QJS10_CPB04g01116 [Acorus calamus]